MNILGIETSCDETAAAIVNEKGEILSNLVLSQLKEHRAFGGVVPEIAARAHIDHLHTLIEATLEDANLTIKDIDGVAATCGPGLIGGVMIGMIAAKAIAASQNIPFIAVNHLEGHALTARLTDNIAYPYLMLLVSGGHTQLLIAEKLGKYRLLGGTLDDAAGECFDKSAKLMGLPYPGGPELQAIARECKNPQAALERFPLPTPMKGRDSLDFSFSGLKTAIRNAVETLPEAQNNTALKREDIADLAYAFQHTIADVIADRCIRAIELFKAEYSPQNPLVAPQSRCSKAEADEGGTLVLCGGVAANEVIRAKLDDLCAEHNMCSYAPPLSLCGDNAAMIAWAGMERLQNNTQNELNFKARPRWPLDETA